ncbi:MAG: class I SAM-dependent methyltransferase [Nocardioidaceae bacterium]
MSETRTGAYARATARSLEEGGPAQPRYRRYQFELVSAHCGRSVLVVGAGLGEFAARFDGLHRLVLSDVDPLAVEALSRRFAGRADVETLILDLDDEPSIGQPVETAIAINVLEHIEDDVGALTSLSRLVRPGGSLVLWVPAFQALYGDFDRKVGHFRRYSPESLRQVVQEVGLEVEVCRPINFFGGLAWWLAVRKGRAGSPRPGMVRLYDRFVVPGSRFVDQRMAPPFGQSVFCIARAH